MTCSGKAERAPSMTTYYVSGIVPGVFRPVTSFGCCAKEIVVQRDR